MKALAGLVSWLLPLAWGAGSASPAQADCASVARVQEVSGDVRVKHPGNPNWVGVSGELVARCGDLLFVGQGGVAKLYYLREKSSVALPPRSIFEVEERLPLATKFKRSFGNNNYQGSLVPRELSPDGKFSKTLMAPNRDNMGAMEAELASGSANTVVERKVVPLRFLDPPGPLRVVARKFPATIAVALDVPRDDVRIYGYLWNESGSVAPVWTGTSSGYFSEIRIDEPGQYIFQALSEDDAFASSPLRIVVEKIGQNVGPERVLPGKWEGRYTVIVR